MSENAKAAFTNYILWLTWYPRDYKGATEFAGDYLETPEEVDELKAALESLAT